VTAGIRTVPAERARVVAGVKPQDTSVSLRRDFGGLVHLLPNWGASTGGWYPDARW
jgi:hypothetical protein